MDLTQQWPSPPAPEVGVTRARVEYRLDGVQLELDAIDCDDVPFERGDPVRSFPSWRLKRHYDGYHWMGVLGASIGFESLTERSCLIELDRTPGVVAVASQPMWIRWVTPDGLREHYPDYFVRLEDGQAVLMDVKPAAQIKDDVRKQFDMTAVFAAYVSRCSPKRTQSSRSTWSRRSRAAFIRSAGTCSCIGRRRKSSSRRRCSAGCQPLSCSTTWLDCP